MNIETRVSNRAKSIFEAFGTTINDFYLEAGIYFIGGFNALLVAWDVYTDLQTSNEPLLYAVIIAIVTFIAVEGLAVYLVGAAAKTGNPILWFFSVVFAAFFTFAHYKQMVGEGNIAAYLTFAIPFFVVVGYWARTVKIDLENNQVQATQQRNDAIARQQKMEDEQREFNKQSKVSELARQQELEDKQREFGRQLQLAEMGKNHELKMAEIEAKKGKNIGQNGSFLPNNGSKLSNANQAKKDKIVHRRKQVLALANDEKLTQIELAERLGVSLGTIKNDLRAMNGKVTINGNG